MPSAFLDDRAVVTVSGQEARAYLDRLVTSDIDPVAPGVARFGALLTPQGKIIADFITFAGAAGDGSGAESVILDCPASVAADLVKRLALYRLRAKIAIADRSADLAVVAGWGGSSPPECAEAWAPDPRLPALGWRAIVSRDALPAMQDAGASAYHAHRIALGVPESGRDFGLGDAFPHEAMMDQLAGIDFDKGCYVGQEVVSRMQHRGTARTRTVPVAYAGDAPPPGSEVTAGERVLGRTGSVSGAQGLALLRLDRVGDALSAGDPITAGGVPLALAPADWIRFPLPDGRVVPAA